MDRAGAALVPASAGQHGRLPPRREGLCKALRTTLVDLNSDAVLVNTLTSVPAMLAAVELGIPSLVWVHGVLDSLLLPERASEFAGPHDELLLHHANAGDRLPNYTSDFCAGWSESGASM